MALFIYDKRLRDEMQENIARAGKLQSMTTLGVDEKDLRYAVRVLSNHNVMVIPDQVMHCTPIVERLKAIAHLLLLDVQPLTGYEGSLAREQKRA